MCTGWMQIPEWWSAHLVDFFDIYSDNFKNMVLGTLRYSPTDRPTAQEIFERVTKLHQTSTSESMADRQVFLCGSRGYVSESLHG